MKKLQADFIIGAIIFCASSAIVLAIAYFADIWIMNKIGMIIAACGLISVLCSILLGIWEWCFRPWRSGTHEYQMLKNHTYKQLKESPEKRSKIQQAFYLSAERCNVDRNTAVKDWYLICGEARRND